MMFRPGIQQSFSRARSAMGGIALSLTATLASFPSAAQTMVATTPAPNSQSITQPVVLTTEQCNYLFNRADAAVVERGKNFLSPSTRKGLKAFYAFDANDLPTCKGPREIPWERDTDFAFIMALGDSATGAFKDKFDFRTAYGFKPAARPVAAAAPNVSQRSDLSTIQPKFN